MNIRKNFIGVLKAFEQMDDKSYKLLIVGSFSSNFNVDVEIQKLIINAKQNSNIVFKSGINNDELMELYNESILFVFPSFFEGFGLPVLEAMACGTPVICSDKSSLPEVGGDAVLYCNPYEISDIKHKIELVISDKVLQNRMAQKGLKRANGFSWDKAAHEHIKLFEELLKN